MRRRRRAETLLQDHRCAVSWAIVFLVAVASANIVAGNRNYLCLERDFEITIAYYISVIGGERIGANRLNGRFHDLRVPCIWTRPFGTK